MNYIFLFVLMTILFGYQRQEQKREIQPSVSYSTLSSTINSSTYKPADSGFFEIDIKHNGKIVLEVKRAQHEKTGSTMAVQSKDKTYIVLKSADSTAVALDILGTKVATYPLTNVTAGGTLKDGFAVCQVITQNPLFKKEFGHLGIFFATKGELGLGYFTNYTQIQGTIEKGVFNGDPSYEIRGYFYYIPIRYKKTNE